MTNKKVKEHALPGLSVVINTYNEEKDISSAINSVKNVASEIIVCDMESNDKTVEIAKKLGAKIYPYQKTGYVEPARNFAISKANNSWILILDADELLSQELVNKIKSVIKNNSFDYFRIPRKNIIFNKWIKNSRWWPDYNIRLFKKGSVVWNEIIHSVPLTQGSGSDFEALEELSIVHNNYKDIEEYLLRMNRYSTLLARLMLKDGYDFDWKDLLTKPVGEFASRYFLGKGYKDGIHGLSLALLQAFSELVIYLKVWEMSGFQQKDIALNEILEVIRIQEKTLKYWQNDARYGETGKLVDRLRRKLKI